MKSAVPAHRAHQETVRYLIRKLQGNNRDVDRQIRDCCRVIKAVNEKFGVGIYQLRFKHIHWYLAIYGANLTPKTRYNHWCAVRRIVESRGKEKDWLPKLKGPWIRKDGNCSQPIANRRPSKKATPAHVRDKGG